MRSTLFVSTAIGLMMVSTNAFAQEMPKDDGIGDIIVTAQKRSESLQKVSASVQVLSKDEVSRVSEVKDITSITPGVQIGMGGAAAQIYMRGVGDQSNNAASNPGVAVNIDGVYVARSSAIAGAFYDLERIEILKGPQGTLYGRNASGGAINIIASKPQFNETGGYAEVKVGNYDMIAGDGAINLAISDAVAIRGAFNIVSREGYTSAGTDDDKQRDARLSARFRFGNAELLLSGDYSKIGGHGSAFVPFPGSANYTPGMSPWTDISEPIVNDKLQAAYAATGFCVPVASLSAGANPAYANLYTSLPRGACGQGEVSSLSPISPSFNRQNNEFWSVHAQLDWDLGFANLTVLPAYRSANLDYTVTGTDAPVIHTDTSRMTSVEARLSRDTNGIKWVAGLYYYDEKQTAPSRIEFGLANNILSQYNLTTRAYAAFGQTTVKVAEGLRLIAGLRYTIDKRGQHDGEIIAYQPDSSFLPPYVCDPTLPSCVRISGVYGSRTFKATTWKAGVEYDLAPENMLYFTASTGFKAGGLQLFPTSATNLESPSFEAEKLTAFEFGSRNRFFDNKLQVNLELFRWGYKQHQGFAILFDPTLGLPQLTITNDGNARMYGGDLDIVAKLSSRDTLHLGVEYLNARYTEGSLKGNVLPFSPKWSGSASYEHVFPLASGGKVLAQGALQFASSRWASSDYTLSYAHLDGYVKGDLSLSYVSPEERWTLTAFLRNITNKAVYTQGVTGSFAAGSYSGTIQAPRTFGASLKVNF